MHNKVGVEEAIQLLMILHMEGMDDWTIRQASIKHVMDLKLVDHHDLLVAKVEEEEGRPSGRNDLTEIAKGDSRSVRHASESNSTNPRSQSDNVETDLSWSIPDHKVVSFAMIRKIGQHCCSKVWVSLQSCCFVS